MRPGASDYNGDGNALRIDWMRLTPYAAVSTYSSAILDASGTATWTTAAWTGATPAGTAVVLSVRTGDSPAPDASWTPFTVVTGPIDVTAGYLQYRLQLSSTRWRRPPLVNNVTIDLNANRDREDTKDTSARRRSTLSLSLRDLCVFVVPL